MAPRECWTAPIPQGDLAATTPRNRRPGSRPSPPPSPGSWWWWSPWWGSLSCCPGCCCCWYERLGWLYLRPRDRRTKLEDDTDLQKISLAIQNSEQNKAYRPTGCIRIYPLLNNIQNTVTKQLVSQSVMPWLEMFSHQKTIFEFNQPINGKSIANS